MIGAAPARTGEAGFTVVEALVALAIVAAVTGAAFEAVAADARVQAQVRARREAVLVAQSVLARAVAGEDAASGRDGGFSWRVARAPYGFARTARIERVTVSVGSGARPLVLLQTLAMRS